MCVCVHYYNMFVCMYTLRPHMYVYYVCVYAALMYVRVYKSVYVCTYV